MKDFFDVIFQFAKLKSKKKTNKNYNSRRSTSRNVEYFIDEYFIATIDEIPIQNIKRIH